MCDFDRGCGGRKNRAQMVREVAWQNYFPLQIWRLRSWNGLNARTLQLTSS